MTNIHRSLTKRTNANGNGQVMIEFALVIPILVMLFLGVMDLARAVYAYGVVSDAARVGAHWGSLRPLTPVAVLDLEHGDIDFADVKFRFMGGGPKNYPSKVAGLDRSHITPAVDCVPNESNPYMKAYTTEDEKQIHKCDSWNFIRVTVTYEFQPITLFFVPIKLQSESTMTIE